jgi:MFS family permease
LETTSSFGVLARPQVRRWVAARFCSGTGVSMLRTTALWNVYDATGSLATVGLLGLVTFLPAPLLSLGGGVMADRADRKRIVLFAQAVELACAVGFAVASARGALTTALLFVLYTLNGGAIAFESPARQAVLPSLVPREDLRRAVTVMSTAHALAFVSGPAVAGLFLATGGATSAYGCAAALLTIAWSFVARVAVPESVRASEQASALGSLLEGFRFLRRSPIVLAAMTLDLFAVIFGGATAMLPVYAKDILAVGPRGYGLLSAALDVGAVAMSLLLLFLPPVQRLGRTVVLGVVGYGAATIVFGLSRTFELSLAAYVAVGFFDQLSVVGRSALVQLSTPDELRGRVSSVNTVFILASNQLTLAESGFLAAMTSPTFSVVFGGVVVFVVTGVVLLVVPALLRAQQPADERSS